ncbi:hypothetical protein D9M69_581950 [compost metagenome]
MNAIGRTTLIDTIKTVIGTHTGANFLFPLFDNLAHDMRVGHMRPRHTHHIELAGRNCVTRCRHILNFRRMKGRHACARANFASKIKMRCTGHTLNGNNVRQSCIGFDMPANDVEKIDETALLEFARDFKTIRFRQSTFQHFISNIANTDQKIGADTFAHGTQYLQRKAHTIVERAAIFAF